ncbi:MAG: hypothetical protein JJU21_12605 [Salinarimonas sp.]|nr:hypothetical protein [Salinarimonas sp.]
MWIIDLWRWRISRRRVAAEARRLLDEHGVRAFFRAHEDAWRAQGEDRNREARFHRAVCYAISRHLQRRAVLEAVFAPYGRQQGTRHAADAEAMQVVHAQLLRDFA